MLASLRGLSEACWQTLGKLQTGLSYCYWEVLTLRGRSKAEVMLTRTGSNPIRKRKQAESVAGMRLTGTESRRNKSLSSSLEVSL